MFFSWIQVLFMGFSYNDKKYTKQIKFKPT